MTEEIKRKVKLGRKEQQILDFLRRYPEGIWKERILDSFTISGDYRNVMIKRLYRMQEKGLIEIRTEINPETGRKKQRIYLKE